jgi:hypothetical protein
MTSTRAPLTVARAGVELSVRALPDWEDRLRYRAEYLAELHDLAPAGQLRYTVGVLSQTFALRTALGSSPNRAEEDAIMITTTQVRFWRCRVFHMHRWVSRSTEDGARYLVCARCGRDRDDIPFGSFSIGGPSGAG